MAMGKTIEGEVKARRLSHYPWSKVGGQVSEEITIFFEWLDYPWWLGYRESL